LRTERTEKNKILSKHSEKGSYRDIGTLFAFKTFVKYMQVDCIVTCFFVIEKISPAVIEANRCDIMVTVRSKHINFKFLRKDVQHDKQRLSFGSVGLTNRN
jgi:hypothetical protein